MAGTSRYRTAKYLILSLILFATLVPVTYLTAPHFRQWSHIRGLTSTDAETRQRALRFLVANAQSSRTVRAGAVDALGVEDDANFLQLVDALQAAGCWYREIIPDDAWLRWLSLQSRVNGIEAPALAAQRLAALQDLADDPRLTSLLAELSRHTGPDVRYNALCAAAELFLSASKQAPYHELITERTNDPEPVIAHHARLFAYITGAADALPHEGLHLSQTHPPDLRYGKQEVLNLLRSQDAPLRDVGCVLAVRDLDEDELESLIPELLAQTNSAPNMSGAILAGMSGLHAGLLRQQIVRQTDWVTATVMMMGLWMRGDDYTVEVQPGALLAHGDVPRTTLILTMLYRRDPQALDVLLNPRGETPDDLIQLLDSYGWWRVLNYYLPGDAPRWQPGTDSDTQQLQIDLLRDWYLVHRHGLMNRSLPNN